MACYQCGRKGHKKSDCTYYKPEFERKKNTGDKKKKDIENEARNNFKDKDKEKAIVASIVIIEEPSDAKDILCATMGIRSHLFMLKTGMEMMYSSPLTMKMSVYLLM